jgi:hypothetical protein
MTERTVSPEWLTSGRADFEVDTALKGGWGVSPAPLMRGASFTDFGTHEMAVPVGDTEAEKAVRLHELVHARISPTSVPVELMEQLSVSPSAVRIAEEVRVNAMALRASMVMKRNHGEAAARVGHIDNLSDGSEKTLAKEIVKRASWDEALGLFLTTMGTDVFKSVKRTLRTNKDWREPLALVENEMENQFMISKHHFLPYQFANTDAVRFIHKDRTGNEKATLLPEGFLTYTMPLAEMITNWFGNPPVRMKRRVRETSGKKEIESASSNWEPLRIGLTSLTETTSSFLGRRKRPAMTGKYPSRPDRLLTDPERRIFREVVRAQGGVVVFDCSGSMNVDHDVVRAAVEQFAGATVLLYSNNRTQSANAWVVARSGRMVHRDEFVELPLNNGNGVDGLALRWAIRTAKKGDFILWVSDGGVTGKNDRCYEGLVEDCARLSVRHNIIGADNCHEAIQILSDMKRGRKFRHKFCPVIEHTVQQMKRQGDL